MSNRYETPGPWEETMSVPVYNPGGLRADAEWYGEVTILNGPAIDTRNGVRYPHGAYKVEVRGPKGRPRASTFIGDRSFDLSDNYAWKAVRWLEQHRDQGRGL